MGRAALVALLAVWGTLLAASGATQNGDSPIPTPSPTITASPASATSTPVPTIATPPVSTPQPMATPLYHFVFVPSPPPDPPQQNAPRIREIDLTDSVLYAPGELHIRVLTTPEVVSVTAGTMGHDIAIPARGAGVFAFDGYIPSVPDFVRNRVFDVAFVAATADGRSATVTLPLTLK